MKPELLLPAGSPEAFLAALEGGADAVYLGLPRFNARGRAKNFTLGQFEAVLRIARERSRRVYLTLNTLIRNEELPLLLDTLHYAEQARLDGVLVQDWGAWHFVRTRFPRIVLHASTQLGIHNSIGTAHAAANGFRRVVLARELTLPELEAVRRVPGIELEVFVHGALCYSLSGHCLFSSYLGGMSANRGLCRQPCRRLYGGDGGSIPRFSLRDLQLLRLVPELARIGIDALKVEGRMKTAEYVFRVAGAYRSVLDDPSQIPAGEHLLENDFGRPKTGYFAGGDLREAFTTDPFTGRLLGEATTVTATGFSLSPAWPLSAGDRLRIQPASGEDSAACKVRGLEQEGQAVSTAEPGRPVTVLVDEGKAAPGDRVFLIAHEEKKFRSRVPERPLEFRPTMPDAEKRRALEGLRLQPRPALRELLVRIDSLAWLAKTHLPAVDRLVIDLPEDEWAVFDPSRPRLAAALGKLVVGLPLFLPESRLAAWQKRLAALVKAGCRTFLLAQPAQRLLLPADGKGLDCWVGEQAYSLNDAAAAALGGLGFSRYILPFENDFPNLKASHDRSGIVPLYYVPRLFVSRAPVAAESVTDRTGTYRIEVRDGLRFVLPEVPVALFPSLAKIAALGYRRFLVDLSFEKPSKHLFERLVRKAASGEAEQPSTAFNMKRGLT